MVFWCAGMPPLSFSHAIAVVTFGGTFPRVGARECPLWSCGHFPRVGSAGMPLCPADISPRERGKP